MVLFSHRMTFVIAFLLVSVHLYTENYEYVETCKFTINYNEFYSELKLEDEILAKICLNSTCNYVVENSEYVQMTHKDMLETMFDISLNMTNEDIQRLYLQNYRIQMNIINFSIWRFIISFFVSYVILFF